MTPNKQKTILLDFDDTIRATQRREHLIPDVMGYTGNWFEWALSPCQNQEAVNLKLVEHLKSVLQELPELKLIVVTSSLQIQYQDISECLNDLGLFPDFIECRAIDDHRTPTEMKMSKVEVLQKAGYEFVRGYDDNLSMLEGLSKMGIPMVEVRMQVDTFREYLPAPTAVIS